jgi:hypothetical protein
MGSMQGNSDIDESALSAAMAGMNLVQTDATINHKQQSKSAEENLGSMFADQKNYRQEGTPPFDDAD